MLKNLSNLFNSNPVDQLFSILMKKEALSSDEMKKAMNLIDKMSHVDLLKDKKEKNYGATPLLLAAIHGHIEIAAYLIGKGVFLDTQDNDRRTALMYAVIKGHPGLVTQLIRSGADKTKTDMRGMTAEEHAKETGNVEIANILKTTVAENKEEIKSSPRSSSSSSSSSGS